MKVTKRQLRRLIHEAQWGRFTGGAAPLDMPVTTSGPIPKDQLKKLRDIYVDDMGMSPEEVLQTPEFIEAGITDLSQLKESNMKITKRQLRRLIKEEIYPLYPLRSLREAPAGDVEAAIAKYTSPEGLYAWRMAAPDFYAMADGEIIPNVSDEYYAGWTPEDFETVITAVEG
jgi:hypothetical protein